jgi:uncharacterized protein (TIGR02996 family)
MQSRRLVSESRFFEITWRTSWSRPSRATARGGRAPAASLPHPRGARGLRRSPGAEAARVGLRRGPPEAAAPDDPGKAAELEALIEADLDSVEPFLVYADWLQARGDPRGELAALQHRLATSPTDELREEEGRLLSARAAALLGPLADCPQIARLGWRLGFVERACLFVDRSPDYDEPTLMRTFLAHPACRFLRELVLCDRDLRLDSLADALLRAPPRPTVTRLQLGAPEKPPRVHVSSALLARFPRLVELRLFALPLALEPLEHASLARLVLGAEATGRTSRRWRARSCRRCASWSSPRRARRGASPTPASWRSWRRRASRGWSGSRSASPTAARRRRPAAPAGGAAGARAEGARARRALRGRSGRPPRGRWPTRSRT